MQNSCDQIEQIIYLKTKFSVISVDVKEMKSDLKYLRRRMDSLTIKVASVSSVISSSILLIGYLLTNKIL